MFLNPLWDSCVELDSLTGLMNHSTIVVPLHRHFLGRLCRVKDRHKKLKRIRLTVNAILYLKIWWSLLERDDQGVSTRLVL